MWLALALLLLLAPLPFVTEENADRILRVLPFFVGFIIPLIMLAATMFPHGLRLPLGPVVLRIAPPAAYLLSHYSASRWLEDGRSRFLETADELDAMRGEQDALTTRIVRIFDEAEVEIGVDRSELADLAVGMFLRSHTNYDAVLSAATAAATDALREKLAQPAAATTAGILDQHAAWQSATVAATGLIKARMAAWDAFAGDTLQQVKGMAIDSLTKGMEQRSQAAVAQIAAIEAEVAELARQGPGRPPKQVWSDDEIRALHAAYLERGVQTAAQFAGRNHLTESQMFKLFRRIGITKKGPGNFDSEF